MAYPTAAELLPTWLRVVWVVLLVGVLAVLVLRVARTPAPARWWHAAYALMTLGMLAMYAFNPMDTPGFNGPALLVFVVALIGVVALAAATVIVRRRGGASTVSWVIALVDMVAVAYIQIPADVRPVIVCVLFACYLAVVAVLRLAVAVRALRRAPQRWTLALVDPGGGDAPGDDTDPGHRPDGGVAAPARARTATHRATPATDAVALAVLALSMIYMLSV